MHVLGVGCVGATTNSHATHGETCRYFPVHQMVMTPERQERLVNAVLLYIALGCVLVGAALLFLSAAAAD
jgi:hypothetical protein